ANTTQALQVQRATIATIKSFMGLPESGSDPDSPSPLEVAFGIKPAGQAKIHPAQNEDEAGEAEQRAGQADGADGTIPGIESAQSWWNMLQEQFNVLASATASTMQASQQAQQQAMDAAASA